MRLLIFVKIQVTFTGGIMHLFKKHILITTLVSFILLSPAFTHIATAESLKNQIMINPLALSLNNFCPEYEFALSTHFGLGLRANLVLDWEFTSGKNKNDPDDDYDWIYKINGYGVGVSARMYPGGNAPEGFYLGPRADFIGFQGTYEDRANNNDPVDSSLMLGTAHLEIGYKFTISNTVVLGFFGDAGYAFAQAKDASVLLTLLYIVGGGVYVGYAF
jgi:hypothetical protein